MAKSLTPARELEILLRQARQGDESPLCAKVVNWTGDTVKIVLLADTDAGNGPWLRGRAFGRQAD